MDAVLVLIENNKSELAGLAKTDAEKELELAQMKSRMSFSGGVVVVATIPLQRNTHNVKGNKKLKSTQYLQELFIFNE